MFYAVFIGFWQFKLNLTPYNTLLLLLLYTFTGTTKYYQYAGVSPIVYAYQYHTSIDTRLKILF